MNTESTLAKVPQVPPENLMSNKETEAPQVTPEILLDNTETNQVKLEDLINEFCDEDFLVNTHFLT